MEVISAAAMESLVWAFGLLFSIYLVRILVI